MKKAFHIDIVKYIVIGSSFYLAIAPIGIAHICFIVGLLLLLYSILTRRSDSSIIWLILLLFFSFFQLHIGASWKAMINNVSSMMMFIIVINILKDSSFKRIILISSSFIRFTTFLLIGECILRMALSIPKGISLYNLKFNSFMFLDTNFCGLLILVLLCFGRYLIKFYNVYELKKFIVVDVVLLVLTLSRAAIIGYIVFEILFYNIKIYSWKSSLIKRIIILTIISTAVGSVFINIAMHDDSFNSKLYILGLVNENLPLIYDIIWTGIGYEHGQQFLGIYPHNFFLLYIIEIGVIGLIFKIGFICYCIYRTHGIGFFIVIPFMVPIQSAIGYATHYLFVTLALITLLENNKSLITSAKYET